MAWFAVIFKWVGSLFCGCVNKIKKKNAQFKEKIIKLAIKHQDEINKKK